MKYSESTLVTFVHSLLSYENLSVDYITKKIHYTPRQDTGPNEWDRNRKQAKHRWTPPSPDWYKWNADVSRIESTSQAPLAMFAKKVKEKLFKVMVSWLETV